MKRREDHRRRIQRRYGGLAKGDASSRKGEGGRFHPVEQAKRIGYTDAELSRVPAGAIMGMGCGNPTALAELRPGETVLDIGCGGGLDAFLAADAVGKSGKVFGVDPTRQMVEKARENARSGDYGNVRFEQGEVEHLPIGDDSRRRLPGVQPPTVDVVISNCVINHCLDKLAAFREILRVLRPGGRMHIADLVTVGKFSREVFDDRVWGAWLTAASGRQEYLEAIRKAGFTNISVSSQGLFGMTEADQRLAGRIESIRVTARK
jgi:SAM-dependent methyltransferase